MLCRNENCEKHYIKIKLNWILYFTKTLFLNVGYCFLCHTNDTPDVKLIKHHYHIILISYHKNKKNTIINYLIIKLITCIISYKNTLYIHIAFTHHFLILKILTNLSYINSPPAKCKSEWLVKIDTWKTLWLYLRLFTAIHFCTLKVSRTVDNFFLHINISILLKVYRILYCRELNRLVQFLYIESCDWLTSTYGCNVHCSSGQVMLLNTE